MKSSFYILLIFFPGCLDLGASKDNKESNPATNTKPKSMIVQENKDVTGVNEKIDHSDVMTCIYNNEILKWCGFWFDYQYLFPRKGHNIFLDSAYVRIPYPNGVVWYEGLFIKYSKKHHAFLGKGVHIIRNEDGSLKGEIDFVNEVVKRIQESGKLEQFSFEEFKKIEPHMIMWWKQDPSILKFEQ